MENINTKIDIWRLLKDNNRLYISIEMLKTQNTFEEYVTIVCVLAQSFSDRKDKSAFKSTTFVFKGLIGGSEKRLSV